LEAMLREVTRKTFIFIAAFVFQKFCGHYKRIDFSQINITKEPNKFYKETNVKIKLKKK
jgi:hypothetical protein